ncbi:TPA: Dot/Icm T4SS effector SdbC [Legionella pneumophila]|nr:Dot/Icm T4SS effector SdbC [Legionella pneumophila]
MPNSSIQIWLQRQIALRTFPPNREDWYVKNGFGNSEISLEERFACFVEAIRQEDSPYHEQLSGIDFHRFEIEVTLANQKTCMTEVIGFQNNSNQSSSLLNEKVKAVGKGKHVIYFTGIGTQYQDCLIDIAKAVQITGAHYYAFEYPGMRKLGGEVLEVNDMVNTGIALANTLLEKGISIDDILFQGDSFGAAVAKKVSDQFKLQSNVTVRCILNNTFSTFQAAVEGNLGAFSTLRYTVRPLLRYTGWDIRPGDNYGLDTPYQIHINHTGDLTLGAGHATLAESVESNSQLEHFVDPCPEEYRIKRDIYKQWHWASLSEQGIRFLETKYGRNSDGQLDTHLADLYLLKYDTGLGVYESFICKYLEDSNDYIANHPQKLSLEELPSPLESETVSLGQLIVSVLPSRPSIAGFFGRPKPVKDEVDSENQAQKSIELK